MQQFPKPRRTRRGSILSDIWSGWKPRAASGPPGTAPGGGSTPGVGGVTEPMIGVGAVGNAQLQPGAFDITKFASGIRPVSIVASLPTLPDAAYPADSVVILTSDHKLYRNAAGTWTKATDGTDIVADSITAGQIAAGAIGASEIAAGAITAEKLTVGVLKDSAILNGSFEELSATDATSPNTWSRSVVGTSTAVSTSTAAQVRSGARAIALFTTAAGGNPFSAFAQGAAQSVPVAEGETWYVSGWAKSDTAATGLRISATLGSAPGLWDISTLEASGSTTTAWTKFEATMVIPAGVRWATLWVSNYNPDVTNTKYVDDITLQKAVGTANIIDANIVNAKIANLTLTADKYFQVRNVIQIPFDDSVDSTHPLECFFQMPTGVVTVKSAKVWVQQKSFRQYVTASSGAADTGHTHTLSFTSQSTGGASTGLTGSDSASSSAHTTDAQGTHDHGQAGENFTGSHSHNVNGHSHSHTHSINHNHQHDIPFATSGGGGSHSHAITLTPGIFETAAAGTMSLKVADDGSTYGANVVSGVTSITAQAITLSTTAGDRRIKIEATGLQRVQVLIVMDLILQLGAP